MLRSRFRNLTNEALKARPRIGFKLDALLFPLGGGFCHGHETQTLRVTHLTIFDVCQPFALDGFDGLASQHLMCWHLMHEDDIRD